MATSSAINNEPVGRVSTAKVDMKLEVIVIPVADVCAKSDGERDWILPNL